MTTSASGPASGIAMLGQALPRLQPDDPGARLLLFGIRQMGAGGLTDAAARACLHHCVRPRFPSPADPAAFADGGNVDGFSGTYSDRPVVLRAHDRLPKAW